MKCLQTYSTQTLPVVKNNNQDFQLLHVNKQYGMWSIPYFKQTVKYSCKVCQMSVQHINHNLKDNFHSAYEQVYY